jgi:hypothetical protein
MYDSEHHNGSFSGNGNNSLREPSSPFFNSKKLAVRTSFGWNPFQKRGNTSQHNKNEPESFLLQQHKPLLDTSAEEVN